MTQPLDDVQSEISKHFSKDSYLGKQENVNHIIDWVTLYKRNLHRFAEHYLKLQLHWYQSFILFMMNLFPSICLIASRATAKSYIIAIFACCKAILYPYSQIVVASATKSQSKLIVSEKIKKELMRDSAVLRKEISDIKDGGNEVEVMFKNGSSIIVVPASDNARGHRATVIIYEEFRMIKKFIIDSVLSPCLIARQAPYLKHEKYSHLPAEEPIEIWISSSWFSKHWMWDTVNLIRDDCLNRDAACILAMDYSITLRHKIKTEKFLQREKKKLDPMSWAIEYENQIISQNIHGFFPYDILNVNQVLKKAFYPVNNMYYSSNKKNQSHIPRIEGEIRILSCDIAMVENDKNDNSVSTCIRLFPEVIEKNVETETGYKKITEKGYRRQVPYIESRQGGETVKQAIRIKQLFEDFDADYCILDLRNAGISVYDALAKIMYDEERDKEYRAWTSMNDDNTSNRIKIENALPVVYTISATAKMNNDIAVQMRETFASKNIDLLVVLDEAIEELQNKITNYSDLTPDEQLSYEKPYLETSFLINELLEIEYTKGEQSGLISISEPSTGRKDRYTSLSYGNYFAALLERDLLSYNADYEYVFEYS